MYICVCRAITERQIRQEILYHKIRSFSELTQRLGIASECGKCRQAAKQIFEDCQPR